MGPLVHWSFGPIYHIFRSVTTKYYGFNWHVCVLHCCRVIILFDISDLWAASWQNQQNGCAPSEDSDQPGHPPGRIRAFAVRMEKAWVLSYPLSAQRILWSDWADAQADPSLRWAHGSFYWFCSVAAYIYIFRSSEAMTILLTINTVLSRFLS